MILVCEPQCAGFEHVPFNAAFLAVVRCAFPEEDLVFLAERTHLGQVRNALQKYSTEGVLFQALKIPSRKAINLFRLSGEVSICRTVYGMAEKKGCRAVIFSSITSAGLYVVKVFAKRHSDVSTFIIPHSLLESVAKLPSPLPWEFPFWSRFPLTIGNNYGLTFIALGESIRENLCVRLPFLSEHVRAIDHPYFFKSIPVEERRVKPLCFGTFGVAHRQKGSHLFYRLAEEIAGEKAALEATFILVGHVIDRKLQAPPAAVNVPSANSPLSREEFECYAAMVDYAVFFYPADSYRLTASGAFFDALAFAKPLIAIRNPFFEHYFSRFGDIGYLCDDYAEVKKMVSDILMHGSGGRYERQIKNLLRCRKSLSLEKIGETLAEIIGPQKGERREN
jgi:hypothetical protein